MCKHIKPYFTEFSIKINLELKLVMTFLYEFLLLKVFLLALYLSLILGTKLQPNSTHREGLLTSLPHYTVAQVIHLCLCPLLNYSRQRRGRQQIISRLSKDMSILLFNWKDMVLSNE